jgi:hypothetical protein
MKAIDQLNDSQVLALGRFIAGCARVRRSARWRTQFSECATRNSFVPFSTTADQEQLRLLLRKHDQTVVCRLRTVEIVSAANEVAAAWGESPVHIELTAEA